MSEIFPNPFHAYCNLNENSTLKLTQNSSKVSTKKLTIINLLFPCMKWHRTFLGQRYFVNARKVAGETCLRYESDLKNIYLLTQ